MHVRTHLGDHDDVRVQTVACERGGVVMFAPTPRHRGLCALPGVGRRIVLFRFLPPDVRHQWMDKNRFIVDPLTGAKDELAHRPLGDRPLPTPSRIPHWGQFFAFGQGLQGTVGLPSIRYFEARLAPIGESGPASPYHPLLLCRPAANTDGPMVVVSVDKRDVMWPLVHARRPNLVLAQYTAA